MKTYRIKDYKVAKETLEKYMSNKKEYAFIHYACESIYETEHGNSPRITAICIMFASNKQIQLFSLASLADQQSLDLSTANDTLLDSLEKEILLQFYNYIKKQKSIKYWLHWNMKDQHYGFEALAHRFCKLTGRKKETYQIDHEKTINISQLLQQRYGDNYVSHPRLPNLLQMNNISHLNLLTGQVEAEAYKNRQFQKIDRSLQDKVEAFSEIMDRAGNSELKTNSKLIKDIYGISMTGILTYLRENVWFGLISTVLGGLLINFLYDLLKNTFAPKT